ncbi:hypothetical protein HK101_011651 [Irineochytrium annulatum]|nr:hypothetical protein HK101_011651 [Irineochytrium annulatum]
MLSGSALAIIKCHTRVACAGLFSVLIAQSLAYGLLYDASFRYRSFSVCGNLVVLLAENMWTMGPAIPEAGEAGAGRRAGCRRILLGLLYFGFLIAGGYPVIRIFLALAAVAGCFLVASTFETGWSAWMLFLTVVNIVLYNASTADRNHMFRFDWWSLHPYVIVA